MDALQERLPPGPVRPPLGKLPVGLTAGTPTLTLRFVGDGRNLDWIEFTPTSPPHGSLRR
ncbi:MAG TPA: hypothetical protein HA263_11505 [Methanoregulaceae archaeon]|nr:hypothetical protein [Methanoregulaceae archaeon]